MGEHSGLFKECLDTLDVRLARKVWSEVFPHLPPLGEKALSVLHYSRTLSKSLKDERRFYSHRWLLDHGLPSGLPDHLKPKADRMYPRIVGVVGIATKTRSPLAIAIREAQEYVVNECYADGHQEPEIIRPRMREARLRVLRG